MTSTAGDVLGKRPEIKLPMHIASPCRHGTLLALRGDTVIGPALANYGEFAESENRLMSSCLAPGNTFVDIGANIGTVTMAMSKIVGSTGRIIAFEPQRLVFQTLCANLVLNGKSNVIALPNALGERQGEARIPVPDLTTPKNLGAVALDRTGSGETETVKCETLDSYQLNACHCIKIDVEGMEAEVLAGAEETIRRNRPAIYFEAKSGENTRRCLAWLQARNYRIWWHFALFYEPDNFCGNPNNIFGGLGDINALALPAEAGKTVAGLPEIMSPQADWKAEMDAWRKQGGRVG